MREKRTEIVLYMSIKNEKGSKAMAALRKIVLDPKWLNTLHYYVRFRYLPGLVGVYLKTPIMIMVFKLLDWSNFLTCPFQTYKCAGVL